VDTFWPEHKKVVEKEDYAHARVLSQTIKALTEDRAPISLTKWSHEFRLLRQRHGYSNERIGKVLAWLCANIKAKYTPVVRCARTFREKFTRIEARMNSPRPVEPVEPSPEALEVTGWVSHLGWPKHCKEQIPLCCEITLNNVKDLLKRLRKRLNEEKAKETNPKLIKARIAEIKRKTGKTINISRIHSEAFTYDSAIADIGTPQSFTTRWMRKVNRTLQHWGDFSGKLTSLAWNKDTKLEKVIADDLTKELYQEET